MAWVVACGSVDGWGDGFYEWVFYGCLYYIASCIIYYCSALRIYIVQHWVRILIVASLCDLLGYSCNGENSVASIPIQDI